MIRTLALTVLAVAIAGASLAAPKPDRTLTYDVLHLWWDFSHTGPVVGNLTNEPVDFLSRAVTKVLAEKGYHPAQDLRVTAPTAGPQADYYPSGDFLIVNVHFEGSGRAVVFMKPKGERKGLRALAHSVEFRRYLRSLDQQLLKTGDFTWTDLAESGPIYHWFVAAVRERLFSIGEMKVLLLQMQQLPSAEGR